MFQLLQFIVALLLGLATPLSIAWLIFVYPYSDVSLKWSWIGLVVGFVIASIWLLFLLYAWANIIEH
jgi:hypothetical protein